MKTAIVPFLLLLNVLVAVNAQTKGFRYLGER